MPVVVRVRHVHRFKDRHGRVRHYLRLPGRQAIALPGAPGSPEFMAAYHQGIKDAAPAGAKGPKVIPGSLDALAVAYYASPAFAALRGSTQAAYRRLVEEIRKDYGPWQVRLFQPHHIEDMVAEKAEHPTAANHRLRMLRHLFGYAKKPLGLIDADPTIGVERMAYRTGGYHSWTEGEIEAFEARWPSGSRQRLAFALLLYTGQRRSDVVRMGRQHMRGDRLEVVQVKTGRRLLLPIHPTLRAELDQVPRDRLTFLVTESGDPWSPRGFYNAFVEWVAAAKIPPGRSPHGLRKAAGRRLAEAGATAHEIMAVLGVTLQVAEIYTRAAEQARLATAGISRIR